MLTEFLMGSKTESVQDWDDPKQYGGPKWKSPVERLRTRICFSTDLAGMQLRRLSVLILSQSHFGREKDGPLAGTKEAGAQPDVKWEPHVSAQL